MDIHELLSRARDARKHAYAPYSEFKVGAALLCESGRVFSGCNIENVSLGLTMCAERVCVGAAMSAGEKRFKAIAVYAETETPIVPCGACRQVLAEFSPDIMIISAGANGEIQWRLTELLPHPRDGIMEKHPRET